MGGFAWVTLATNDSYSLGALVLANSLKQVGTKEQLAVLVTPGVTNSMKQRLAQVFNVVYEVNILDSKDAANLRLLQRPELGITFTKLHCWRLVQFDKCVFLDADTLVLQNCDELFEREELSAAPDVGWPDCFNSGVFVFRPSNETYEKLIQFALDKGSFDGGDQGLLNLYFSDWATKDISKHLPFIYNLCSTACYSYLPAFKQFGGNAKIIHFIGASKPWLQYFNTESRKVQPSNDLRHLEIILQHWWNIFCQLIHPNLSPDMARSTSDVAHSSNSHHIPANHQIPKSHSKINIAWDPWEEYDKNQSFALQNPPQTEPYSHEKLIESHNTIATNVVNETLQQQILTPQHYIPSELHNIPLLQHTPPPPQQHAPPLQQYTPPPQQHVPPSPQHVPPPPQHVSPPQQLVPSPQTLITPSPQNISQSQPYIPSQPQHHTPSQSIQSLAEHQQHLPSSQSLSQSNAFPQINSVVSSRAASPPPLQLTNNLSPPQNFPVPPNECEAASTVCKEITMHALGNETNGGLAGAFAQLTLGAPRTAEQLALDDHLRRQGWEVGNIDYMGRDSFDNIWSKICQTLGTTVSPKDPTPPPPEEQPTEKATEGQLLRKQQSSKKKLHT